MRSDCSRIMRPHYVTGMRPLSFCLRFGGAAPLAFGHFPRSSLRWASSSLISAICFSSKLSVEMTGPHAVRYKITAGGRRKIATSQVDLAVPLKSLNTEQTLMDWALFSRVCADLLMAQAGYPTGSLLQSGILYTINIKIDWEIFHILTNK